MHIFEIKSWVIGASLSEPHTNNKFVRWFVHGKAAVKSGMPHTTVSLVGWFKNYNTRKITFIHTSVYATRQKLYLDYWYSIYGCTVVHATNW